MATQIPADAPRSPDGYYWYDGNQWQLIDQSSSSSDQSGGDPASGSYATDDSSGTSNGPTQDAASYLGFSGAGADVLADVPISALSPIGADVLALLVSLLQDLEAMKQHLAELTHHGCWCGAGNVCEEEKDALDSCCHQHDLAYGALGVSSGWDMWSRETLKKTVEADQALVDCARAASGLDSEAELYRDRLEMIFDFRARLGRILRRLHF